MGVALLVGFVKVVHEHNVLLRVSKRIAPAVERLFDTQPNAIRFIVPTIPYLYGC